MAKSLISTNISTQVLKFKPGSSPASFDITVVNESEQFATFQLEVIAAGADANIGSGWYNLSPEISSKTPPGDSTKFNLAIADTPVPGFVGTMNLTVRVFSLELREEDRQLLRMLVEQGTGSVPMQVELPVREFQKPPNELVEIPIRVYNPTQLSTNVVLSFLGVDPSWLVSGIERRLQVNPGSRAETTFLCQLPMTIQTLGQPYPFQIYCAQPNGPSSTAEGVLTVLPAGFVDFSCTPATQTLPERLSWLPQLKSNSATYKLQFQNFGNLIHQGTAKVKAGEDQPDCKLEIIPEFTSIKPGETGELLLVTSLQRKWLGGRRKFLFEVKSAETDETLDIRNDTQVVKLVVLPIIPLWMQLTGGLLLLWLLWWLSWLNPENPFWGHKNSVTSVQFNGLGDKAISSSIDQTMIKWDISGFTNPLINPHEGMLARVDKSVRTIRYKPVDNDLVAAGLENGEIQLWNLLGARQEPLNSFTYQRDDRVLALEFTKDSRYLFSGHGSGTVLQWNTESVFLKEPPPEGGAIVKPTPVAGKKFDFVVDALALVGKDDKNLVIGGRYHQLVIWNWGTNRLRRVLYRPGGAEDYIRSISAAVYKPNRMATSDDKGFITLWDMSQCLVKDVKCDVLDEWGTGHGGKPVRSVALSTNGCYLVSGGSDGRVMFWPLSPNGKRSAQFSNGQQITVAKPSKIINAVDVKVVNQNVLVISGSEDRLVRVDRTRRLPQLGCDTN